MSSEIFTQLVGWWNKDTINPVITFNTPQDDSLALVRLDVYIIEDNCSKKSDKKVKKLNNSIDSFIKTTKKLNKFLR